MGHIIKPERLGLVVCPNEDAHEADDRIRFGVKTESPDGKILRLYVIRLAHQIDGVSHNFNYPPVDFVIALLSEYNKTHPNMPLYIGEKTCATCNGFDNPTLWRRKYRDNSEDYNIDFDTP